MGGWDWVGVCLFPVAMFVYATWSQPDLALWVRLVAPLGWVVFVTGALLDAPIAIVAPGILAMTSGIPMFLWARDGGGPEWFYRKVRQ
jgi:hypothetical protein